MKKAAALHLITEQLTLLSDSARLRLLRLLEREELSVGELARIVQLPQSTVSRQLKQLADGGFVISRSEGTSTLYRLVMDDLDGDQRTLWGVVRERLAATDSGTELAEDLRRLQGVLADRKIDTKSFFGKVAGEWDAVRNELFGDRVTVLALLSLLPAEWTVADLGCGTGNAAELLAPIVRKVIAVDQSGPMLTAAAKRMEHFTNVQFLQGELEKLPIPTGTVDAAVCVLVLHHLESPQNAINEMARILRPGGVAMVVDMVEHDRAAYRHSMGHRWMGFGVPELLRMFEHAGLADTRLLTLPSASDAKGPGLFACTGRKAEKPATAATRSSRS